jgi:ribose/xylose/arabinose/galactoside ABC-type transport system permease subunit
VHVAWEAVLLIGLGVAAALVWSRSTGALSGDRLRDQLVAGSAAVLLASSFAVSLRAAAPNLAAGGIAAAAGVLTGYLANHNDLQLGANCAIAAGAAAGAGLLLGLLVVGLRAPAWAVSLGGVTLLAAAVLDLTGSQPLTLPDQPDLGRWAWALFGGAALLSVGGGAFGAAPRVRAAVSRYRVDGDPAIGRGGPAGSSVLGALVLSALLAAASGLVSALQVHAARPVDRTTALLTIAAFAAALLGGTSVHGRRGGVFGTVLAASCLQLVLLWLALGNVAQWVQVAVLGGAVLVGLGVSRLVEWLGTPPPDEFDTIVPIHEDEDTYPTRYLDLM